MFLYLEPYQFAALEAKAKEAADANSGDIKSFTASGNDGVIQTKDVTFDFHYDAGFKRLSVNIGKRWSLAAKIAPVQVIQAHVVEKLHELVASVPPPVATPVVEEPNDEAQKTPTDNPNENPNQGAGKIDPSIFKKAGL